jgi:hypothetical protein
MTKVILCWTSIDGGFDWLLKETQIDEINMEGVIREYWIETKSQAKALSDKWELDGNPDPLYLNFRMDKGNSMLFRLIDQYMETFD